MLQAALLDNLAFHSDRPNSEPLFVDNHVRILRFALKPGQTIAEHNAPSSPFYVVVLKGTGWFSDGAGKRHAVTPNDLLIFDVAENHAVEAGDTDFVFLGILQNAQQVRDDRVGGSMVRNG